MIRLAPIFAAAFSLSLLVEPAAAGQRFCNPILTGSASAQKFFGDQFSENPTKLGAAWLPAFEHLDAAIPSLSLREEQWLEEEMNASAERWVRAAGSLEFTLREAKNDAGGLLKVARRLSAARHPTDQAGALIWFAYILTNRDAGIYLERLVARKVIQREAIPDLWTLAANKGDVPLHQEIQERRVSLAQHILICTLPSVVDVTMVE